MSLKTTKTWYFSSTCFESLTVINPFLQVFKRKLRSTLRTSGAMIWIRLSKVKKSWHYWSNYLWRCSRSCLQDFCTMTSSWSTSLSSAFQRTREPLPCYPAKLLEISSLGRTSCTLTSCQVSLHYWSPDLKDLAQSSWMSLMSATKSCLFVKAQLSAATRSIRSSATAWKCTRTLSLVILDALLINAPHSSKLHLATLKASQ